MMRPTDADISDIGKHVKKSVVCVWKNMFTEMWGSTPRRGGKGQKKYDRKKCLLTSDKLKLHLDLQNPLQQAC